MVIETYGTGILDGILGLGVDLWAAVYRCLLRCEAALGVSRERGSSRSNSSLNSRALSSVGRAGAGAATLPIGDRRQRNQLVSRYPRARCDRNRRHLRYPQCRAPIAGHRAQLSWQRSAPNSYVALQYPPNAEPLRLQSCQDDAS